MSNNWSTTKLGEVVTSAERPEIPIPGTGYRQIGVRLWGEGAYERETLDGAQTRYAQLFRAEAGDIIVNKIWARNGSVAVVPLSLAGCYGSGEFPMFTPRPDRLDSRWVHWLTKTPGFWAQCDEKSRGTSGKNRIRPEQFLRVEIPLPSLSEQRRIVARIEELAARVEEARRLQKEVEEESVALRNAVRGAVFISAEEQFDTVRLEDLSTRITKGESPEWQGYTYQEQGPLFIRSENVLWGTLDFSSAVRIPNAFHEKLQRSQLRQGDVLINLVGASIGRACNVPDGFGAANVNQAVGVISPRPELLLPDFLVHFLLNPRAQDVIHGGKVETARPNISLGDLRNLEIPKVPISEQRRIVVYLHDLQQKVDALHTEQSARAAELDALMPSILDKAFRGDL